MAACNYQGVNVTDLVAGLEDRRYGFEETTYLLLFGKLPNEQELNMFLKVMSELQSLGGRFCSGYYHACF